MSLNWYDWAGLLGVGLILLAYFLLQAGKLRGDSLPYQITNALGAISVLVSLCFAFNFSAFVLELLWLLVSVYGIVRNWRSRQRQVR